MDVLSHSLKSISKPTLDWLQKTFAHLGFDHLSYSCIDLLQGSVKSVVSHEQGYLLGWDQQLTYEQILYLKTGYQHHPATHSSPDRSLQHIHKLDLVRMADQGLEVLSLGYQKILQVSDYLLCEETLAILAYEWIQTFGFVTHAHEPISETYLTTDYFYEYQHKHQLRGLTWTSFELCIIRGLYAMQTLTEIASDHDVEQKEVEQSLIVIKRKLGDQHMTPATLFKKLKRKGVFQLCMSCYV